ncbi:LamG-like jellyroll fold domain-containing protein [Bacillus sp. 22-7]|uniref:LamG-like jellyroll fold domain-containing protein n=1 Tax=Bacillus sp. 22-7 TaxID=2709707 RepID=UPI0013D5F586|nr:LamG-like jellyroll fold domain-containing protein [Bacillus sp. 22-7]
MSDNIIHFSKKEQIIISPIIKDLKNSFAYEFWIKPSANHKIKKESVNGIAGIHGQKYIIYPGHGQIETQAGTGISIGRNGISVFEHTVNHLPATLVYPTSIKNWTHIAVVYRDKVPFLYINGIFIKKGRRSRKEILYASGIIGGSEYGHFSGELRELRVWSYARTESEILENIYTKLEGNEKGLYNQGQNIINLTNKMGGNKPVINKYPAFIKENMDLLVRRGILNLHQSIELTGSYKKDSSNSQSNNIKLQDNRYLTDVLLFFGCYRRDYEYLLFPVANRLAEKGLSVNLIIYNKFSPNVSLISKNVNVLDYNSLNREYGVTNKAKKYYTNHLAGHIRQFGGEIGLNASRKKTLENFYRAYAYDYLFMTSLLDNLRPKCIYGIHFILNPGCIKAIKATSLPVLCTLIQHGMISVDNTDDHDFKGADLVFLWGDYFKRILNAKLGAPNAVVLGNPKVEQIRKDLNIGEVSQIMRKESGKFTILYILTGSLKQDYNRENLALFLGCISKFHSFKVMYKLHPNSSLDECNIYLRKGLMKKSQIFKDMNIYDLINQADIIIGDFSTSVFEAAAMNKPVIQIFQSNYPENFVKLSYVRTKDELTAIIQKIRYDEKYFNDFMRNQQKMINDMFIDSNGSSERIASHIYKSLGY